MNLRSRAADKRISCFQARVALSLDLHGVSVCEDRAFRVVFKVVGGLAPIAVCAQSAIGVGFETAPVGCFSKGCVSLDG